MGIAARYTMEVVGLLLDATSVVGKVISLGTIDFRLQLSESDFGIIAIRWAI